MPLQEKVQLKETKKWDNWNQRSKNFAIIDEILKAEEEKSLMKWYHSLHAADIFDE